MQIYFGGAGMNFFLKFDEGQVSATSQVQDALRELDRTAALFYREDDTIKLESITAAVKRFDPDLVHQRFQAQESGLSLKQRSQRLLSFHEELAPILEHVAAV